MFWIYGGGFTIGSGFEFGVYNGSKPHHSITMSNAALV
jgi:hypothetical protein